MPDFYTPTHPLCTLSDIKLALRIDESDFTDDFRLNLSIDAASRQIENEVNRRFWQDATPSARVYTAATPFLAEVDDFETTTGLAVATDPYGDGSFALSWSAADYQLEPLNGLLEGQPWPYNKIRAVRSLLFPVYGGIAYPLPYVQALLRVTALWGWSAVPADVRKAAIAQTISLFKADDVPFGSTPFGEMGIVRVPSKLHPTAAALLTPYYRTAILVA